MRYNMTPDTAWLLRAILREPWAEQAIASAAQRKGLPREIVREALYTLMGYLNTFGGIYVSGMAWSPVTFRMRLGWRMRHEITAGSICKAMMHAYGAIVLALSVLWYGVCLECALPIGWSLLPAAAFVSCMLHELGHILAVRCIRQPAVMLSSFGYAAVMYVKPYRKRQSQIVAAAGPCMAAMPYLLYAFCEAGQVLGLVALVVGFVHLCSLLPYFTDGKTLWRMHE